MRRLACLLVAILLAALRPTPALASQWGSSYGDPPGFCPAQSFLPATYTTVVSNDPTLANNPEQSTFWGVHPYPGYDDWYGYWYGDFRGSPGDGSGWRYVGTGWYGAPPLHWNFADWGWAVHGHVQDVCVSGTTIRRWQAPSPVEALVIGAMKRCSYISKACRRPAI